MTQKKPTLSDMQLARFYQALMDHAPTNLDPDDVEYLLAHPEELTRLLEPVAKFRVPYPVHSHHYGPVLTITKEQDLRAIMSHWLRGGNGPGRAQMSSLIRQHARCTGLRFRPYVLACERPQPTGNILKRIAQYGWRPGWGFELVTYLSVRQSEPEGGATRLVSLADDHSDTPYLVLTRDDFTYSAKFIADPRIWTPNDHFFAVKDGDE